MRHELKTWPEFFQPVLDGKKNFELRRNDRNFQVGDELLLREWNPDAGNLGGRADVAQYGYTGREILVRVDGKLTRSMLKCGLEPGYIIMGTSLIP